MNFNRQLNQLSQTDMLTAFTEPIDDLCTYKGFTMDENKLLKIVNLLHRLLNNRFDNLVVNDINVSMYNLYFEDVKKVTPEIIIKALQKTSNEKNITQEKQEDEGYKVYEWNCEHGRALNIRVKHDPGGRILKQNGDTYMDVVEAVKKGFNYYTGDKVVIVKPDFIIEAVNKLHAE